MANVHGLFSNRGKKDDENDDDDDDTNNRYVGGIGARGGGRYEWSRMYCIEHIETYILYIARSSCSNHSDLFVVVSLHTLLPNYIVD